MVASTIQGLLAFSGVASALLGYSHYPTIPKDLTTPVEQRLAIHAPNSTSRTLTQLLLS